MTNTSGPWMVLLLAALLGGGCAREERTSGEFAGHYVAGEELSSFVPCGMAVDPDDGKGYWLASSEESARRYQALVERLSTAQGTAYPKVFLRFRGTLSPSGQYGHLGAYEREVTVGQLLDMSLDGRCPGAKGDDK